VAVKSIAANLIRQKRDRSCDNDQEVVRKVEKASLSGHSVDLDAWIDLILIVAIVLFGYGCVGGHSMWKSVWQAHMSESEAGSLDVNRCAVLSVPTERRPPLPA
jgi:hypothetical protein